MEARFYDQQKTEGDEQKARDVVEKFLLAVRVFPSSNTAEVKELARCYVKQSPYREEAVQDAQQMIERGQKILQVLGDALGYGQRLTLVK